MPRIRYNIRWHLRLTEVDLPGAFRLWKAKWRYTLSEDILNSFILATPANVIIDFLFVKRYCYWKSSSIVQTGSLNPVPRDINRRERKVGMDYQDVIEKLLEHVCWSPALNKANRDRRRTAGDFQYWKSFFSPNLIPMLIGILKLLNMN